MMRPLQMSHVLSVLVLAAALSQCLGVAARAAPAESLSSLVARKAAILSGMHRKARKALVTAAQDEAFADYFHDHGEHHRHAAKQRIDSISLKVQSRFNVEEMCLIDVNGVELSRIVGDRIAHDLSADESGAVFFRPGMALEPRHTLVSPVYLSADADKWVVAYVTPILVGGQHGQGDAQKRALLHFEHGLDVYQEALAKGLADPNTVLLAVDEAGFVLFDSRAPIKVARTGQHTTQADYFERFELGGLNLEALRESLGGSGAASDMSGVVAADGRRYELAIARAEHWQLVAWRATEE
ncbi:MAG: cache domain-containing protein [Gammaproteobacteria bacterium]|nr:cache domain-containing protein [Gammaproteobacteria bacterium]